MIFIVVKWKTKPEWSDRWLDLVSDFTTATRDEPLNLWFEWSRSVDDPTEYVLTEAFADGGAEPHVKSDHFQKAMAELGQALVAKPKIVSTEIKGADSWSELAELDF